MWIRGRPGYQPSSAKEMLGGGCVFSSFIIAYWHLLYELPNANSADMGLIRNVEYGSKFVTSFRFNCLLVLNEKKTKQKTML